MSKNEKQPKITADFQEQLRNLHDLADKVSRLGNDISFIMGKLGRIDQDLEKIKENSAERPGDTPAFIELYNEKQADPGRTSSGEFLRPKFNTAPGTLSNIIPFPKPGLFTTRSSKADPVNFRAAKFRGSEPYLAKPGKPLPANITDFRPLLQRDGLILLSWDMRKTEMGDLYTAYWVTSTGIARYYASKPLSQDDFISARPDHKSYAAEDGIEFYGQEAPACIVHTAPELMMSNPRHSELRQVHIRELQQEGNCVDFTYKYLLTRERYRDMPHKRTFHSTARQPV